MSGFALELFCLEHWQSTLGIRSAVAFELSQADLPADQLWLESVIFTAIGLLNVGSPNKGEHLRDPVVKHLLQVVHLLRDLIHLALTKINSLNSNLAIWVAKFQLSSNLFKTDNTVSLYTFTC